MRMVHFAYMLSMANCYFAKPHCYIPFFMLLISNALLILARDNVPRTDDQSALGQHLSALWCARMNLVLPAGEIPAPTRGAAASPGIESWVGGGNESGQA